MDYGHSLASARGLLQDEPVTQFILQNCISISKFSGLEEMNLSAHMHSLEVLALVLGTLISIASSGSENGSRKYLSLGMRMKEGRLTYPWQKPLPHQPPLTGTGFHALSHQ